MANGIEWILENERRLKDLSKNARNKACDKFGIEEVVDQYADLYRKVLSEKRK